MNGLDGYEAGMDTSRCLPAETAGILNYGTTAIELRRKKASEAGLL